jgi:hypothetical protein
VGEMKSGYSEVEVHGNGRLVWCGQPQMADYCRNRLNLQHNCIILNAAHAVTQQCHIRRNPGGGVTCAVIQLNETSSAQYYGEHGSASKYGWALVINQTL